MTQQFTIKELRRIETEMNNELSYISSAMYNIREEKVATREAAQEAGTIGLNTQLAKFKELTDAKFDIRDVVAKFNEAQGINERTIKIAKLESEILFIEQHIIGFGPVRQDRDYHTNKVEFAPGASLEYVDAKRSDVRGLRRQIQRLKDSCSGINSNNKFVVSDVLLAVFVKYRFID